MKLHPVNIKFPAWLIKELDREAEHKGINRTALIITIIIDYLEKKR